MILLILFFISVLVIFVTFYAHVRIYDYWRKKGVSHRKPIFPFGNILELIVFSENVSKYLSGIYNEFDSPHIGFFAFCKPFLLIKDPVLIKRVLIKDFHIFTNRFFLCDEEIDPILSTSLLGIRSPVWQYLRKKLGSVFSITKTKLMMASMTEAADNLEKFLTTNLDANLEVKDVMSRFSSDVIAKYAFGFQENSFGHNHSEISTYANLIIPTSGIDALVAISFIFTPGLVKLLRYPFVRKKPVNFFRKIFMDLIEKRENSKVRRNDLTDLLVQLKNEDACTTKYRLYGDRLVAQALTFFVGGHETVSSMIAFTLHELAIHSHMQDSLRQEITENLNKFGEISHDVLKKMSYIDKLVLESMRKYPLAPFLHRECSENYVFEETGLKIEKGMPIIIPHNALLWNPTYFPNPEIYDPDRFSKESKHKIPPGVYLPFSDGPRRCIGQRFGVLCIKMGLISVIKNFRIVPNSKTIEPLVFDRSPVLQSKHGINLTITKL